MSRERKEVEQEVADAIRKARDYAHPLVPGLRPEDGAMIKAYLSGLANLEVILREKGYFKSISI